MVQGTWGAILATTIDKYCHISCRYLPPFFEHRSRVVYSKIEYVTSNDEIEHPAVRASLDHFKISDGVEIHYDGDLPSRTGLGSSSAFAVGILHALSALTQVMPSKRQLAEKAMRIEQEILKETVGCQDQIMASFGGMNRVDFLPDGRFSVTPVILDNGRLTAFHQHLLLFFTGFSRTASEIAKEQMKQMKTKKQELFRMREMVDEALSILTGDNDLEEFGKLLDEGWKLKRSLSSKIAPPEVDQIYDEAQQAGAIGGKLLGAGGGGFMLIFARPAVHLRIRERLKHLLCVPVEFESNGSQVIHYEAEAPVT